MAIKHNNQIPNNHFHKDWQRRVRCHFDQPGRKVRRRRARAEKAARVTPRPVDKLRPVVRCPTIKYNRKLRAGRGFTFEELKAAAIPRKLARTIGISVDHRRKNRSEESLAINVERLRDYKARLILFPRKAGKVKSGDASSEDLKSAQDPENLLTHLGKGLTHDSVKTQRQGYSEVKLSEMGKGESDAYAKLRKLRSDVRLVGVRAKRTKAKEDEAAAAKK